MNIDGEREVRELLAETGAYREGHFVLRGGHHVLSYYNCEKLFQYPALASRVADQLYERVRDVHVDFVFTPSISTLVLAFEISRRSGSQFVLHALPFTGADYHFPTGTRLLVVEDVVVEGRSLEHARRWCEQRGGEVAASGALVDRMERPNVGPGAHLYSALRDPVQVYSPQSCPACRDGIPVVPVEANYPQRVK